jgi:hypothetical protein
MKLYSYHDLAALTKYDVTTICGILKKAGIEPYGYSTNSKGRQIHEYREAAVAAIQQHREKVGISIRQDLPAKDKRPSTPVAYDMQKVTELLGFKSTSSVSDLMSKHGISADSLVNNKYVFSETTKNRLLAALNTDRLKFRESCRNKMIELNKSKKRKVELTTETKETVGELLRKSATATSTQSGTGSTLERLDRMVNTLAVDVSLIHQRYEAQSLELAGVKSTLYSLLDELGVKHGV